MTLWTLIVVTYAGVVSASTYQTEGLCKDAASVAQYGQTVQERAETDRNIEAMRREAAARWREEHPPRLPRTDEEREMVRTGKDKRNIGGLVMNSGPYVTVGSDGLIYDWPASYWSGTTSSISTAQSIRFTKCIGPDGATFQVIP